MGALVQCVNTRCTSPPRYRLHPYGRRHHTEHSCARHLGPALSSLLHRYGGPILAYRIDTPSLEV